MKTEFKIISIMMVLACTTLFLIYQDPNASPNLSSYQNDSKELVLFNEQSKKHQANGDDVSFESSKELMVQKLKEISPKYMGIKISDVWMEGYYPFRDTTEVAQKFDFDVSSICNLETNIPLHLQVLSETENFKAFTKKYSSYHTTLEIYDERYPNSDVHYGLVATNQNGQSASTYFHLDSCTSTITNTNPFHLNCWDENTDYRYATFNQKDIFSSYKNGKFCKIELDSWRQSLLDYSKILQTQQNQLQTESMKAVDQKSQLEFMYKMNKQSNLVVIIWGMIHETLDEDTLQDKMIQYEKQYGSLPKELLELIENK